MRARLTPMILVTGLLCACSPDGQAEPTVASLAFTDVRVFDGERVLSDATVLVDGDEIVAIGAGLDVPATTNQTIDGRGRTLLPGLIDAHTHVHMRAMLEQALTFGVTTSLDMFTIEEFATQMRREQTTGGADDRADLFSAGTLATAPGGHGTQYGLQIPTLDGPDDAEAWVGDRVAAGADYIKVVLEGGLVGSLPTLDAATVEAIVDAAHERDLLVVTHVGDRHEAQTAIEAGSDGLAHMFLDFPANEDFVDLAVRAGVFVIPTMPVFESLGRDAPVDDSILSDPHLSPCLTATDRERLANPLTGFGSVDLEQVQRSIRLLHAAGVPIAAGSDAPNPGTTHGASLHRELELLAKAGFTAQDALASATAIPARLFDLDDRGRIAKGLRADLVLVEGDPTEDILAARNIVGVWKAGVRADRQVCGDRARE